MKSRVIVFAPTLYPFHVDLRNELSKIALDARVFTFGVYGNYPFEKYLKNVETIQVVKMPGVNLIDVRGIMALFRFKPNQVIIFGFESAPGLSFYVVSKLIGALPIVVVEENNTTALGAKISSFLQKFRIALTRSLYAYAPIVVAESEASSTHLRRLQVKRSRPVFIRAHGVNTAKFKPLNMNASLEYISKKYRLPSSIADNAKVLFVGELSTHKGADTLIGSIELISRSLDIKPTFMLPENGNLLENAQYHKRLKQLIANGSVVLYPLIDPDDMPMLYNCADCVVLPSPHTNDTSNDRCPNAALEALACGKILIASAVGGIPTIAGDAAILVEPNNSEALASKLNAVLAHHSDFVWLEVKARNRAMNVLSMDKYAAFLAHVASQPNSTQRLL